MQKAKEYDWKDSNMALFGSDTEKKVKKDSAETEPAWKNAGTEVGQQIWRINKFKVEHWPKEEYGHFYNGDSYIILNTYIEKGGDEICYDVHFWIGKKSTQDEYGTAAYKTVELDTLLDDKPIQHREVQGYESALFKGYFDKITIMKGGCDTGFRRVLPEDYKPRLFHIRKESRKLITFNQIGTKKENLTDDDVFIFDTGSAFIQINGANCSHDEKYKASQELQKLHSERPKASSETMSLEEFQNSTEYNKLKDGKSKEKTKFPKLERAMFAVSDEDGSLDMDPVENPVFDLANLEQEHSNDVMILVFEEEMFTWIGKGASIDERKNAMSYACNYASKTDNPCVPISVVSQGKESAHFKELMNAAG